MYSAAGGATGFLAGTISGGTLLENQSSWDAEMWGHLLKTGVWFLEVLGGTLHPPAKIDC